MVLAEKGKEQRKKELEGSIATWPVREWEGRESHSKKGSNLESREGAEMGEERGRHRYVFLKDSGRLKREHFEGEQIAAAWDRTRVREEIGQEQQESRGGEKETPDPDEIGS